MRKNLFTKFVYYYLVHLVSSCAICDRPTSGRFSYFIGGTSKEFCSEGCKKAYLGTFVAATGIIIIGLAVILLFIIPSIISIFIILPGLAVLVYGFYLQSLRLDDLKIVIMKDYNSEIEEKDPQDQMIYSSILQTKVHPCCHQSARLQDKYCACGRAIEYPAEN